MTETNAPENDANAPALLHFGLPKGRIQKGVLALLGDAGVSVHFGARSYRPTMSLPRFEVKIQKPQNIVEMLAAGSRDLGFAGADWVRELNADVVELLDTELDPVRLVLAAPKDSVVDGGLPPGKLVVASEYPNITKAWFDERGEPYTFVRTYGATEVFPPEDADCIVDNTATGATLVANNLEILDTLMTSSTRLYASPRALEDPAKKTRIDDLLTLLRSVLDARRRVLLEVNVSRASLDELVELLPCMREPTISTLHGEAGFAVKVAVLRKELPSLIPQIKQCGGQDLLVTAVSQIVL